MRFEMLPADLLVDLLDELIATLTSHPRARVLDVCLGQPVSPGEIASHQERSGVRLSPAMETLYARHNGFMLHWSYDAAPLHDSLEEGALTVGELPNDFERGIGLCSLLPIEQMLSRAWQEERYNWSDMLDPYFNADVIRQIAPSRVIREVDPVELQRLSVIHERAYSNIYMCEDRRSDQGTALIASDEPPLMAKVYQGELYLLAYMTLESYLAERLVTGGALPLERLRPERDEYEVSEGLSRTFEWLGEEFGA